MSIGGGVLYRESSDGEGRGELVWGGGQWGVAL